MSIIGAIVNLDDVSHINFLHKELGLPELISIRYNPGPGRTGNALIGDPKEAKFGTTKVRWNMHEGHYVAVGD